MSEAIQLDKQLSAGPDGVRYLGTDPSDGARVVVERLFLARRVPHRWSALDHRIRLAAQLRCPGLVTLRGYQGDGDDPYLVLAASRRTLADVLVEGLSHERAIRYVARLAETLAEAHRLGLVHGRICPSRVLLNDDDEIALEMFGTRTGDPRPLSPVDHPCLEEPCHEPESDVRALAVVAVALMTGESVDRNDPLPASLPSSSARLESLLSEMIAADPAARPSMAEVLARLSRAEATEVLASSSAVTQQLPVGQSDGEQLGRYRLVALLGEGGMGRVYRARDVASDEAVAVKVIHDHCAGDAAALARFYREARLLAELDNPHIARFIEVNEDRGRHFLAMELVVGSSLDERLVERGPLDEDAALDVVRDVATALADVHDIGAVHRDVKPANVLLVARPGGGDLAKLCDFGIARTAEPEGEELTQVGMAVGTPHYMSPEQCTGEPVGPATDVYALGISLYKLLAGKVPFNAPDTRAIVFKQITEPVPDLRSQRPDLSAATVRLVERMLAKKVEDRIGDARSLLDAIEEARGGGAADIGAHPRVPESREQVKHYPFHWVLRAPPEALWPHVSNTERLNRAIGLGAPRYERREENGDVVTYAHLQVSGMDLDWREHAYEWVAPRRMGILREFSSGPFVWMRSSVELRPHEGGTALSHVIDVLPRGVLGRAATAMEVGYKARRNLERVYQRIDEHCRAQASVAPADPFEERGPLDAVARARLEGAQARLVDAGVDPTVVAALCAHLAEAPEQEVARIRPRALAHRLGVDDGELLDCCLRATEEGLVEMLWDVICPRCQIPSNIAESLSVLSDHDRCEACDLGFELDFGRSVEVMFRAHPALRKAELGTYCIGGPGHTPHVLVQVRLAPGERFEADLELPEDHYRVAARGLAATWGFSVERGAPLTEWEVDLGRGLTPRQNRVLGDDRQRIVLNNALDREVVARVEKSRGREHAYTAAEVACRPLFRHLFASEVLAPGQLIGVGRVTLLLVELARPWRPGRPETEVFGLLNTLKERAADVAAQESGAVVRLHGDGVLLAFDEPAAALRTGFKLLTGEAKDPLCAAVHTGPAMATTINDRLDYFGRIVRELDTLCRAAQPWGLAVAEAAQADPATSLMIGPFAVDAPVVDAEGVVGLMLSPSREPPAPPPRAG